MLVAFFVQFQTISDTTVSSEHSHEQIKYPLHVQNVAPKGPQKVFVPFGNLLVVPVITALGITPLPFLAFFQNQKPFFHANLKN